MKYNPYVLLRGAGMKKKKGKVTVNEFFKNELQEKRKEVLEKLIINIIKSEADESKWKNYLR